MVIAVEPLRIPFRAAFAQASGRRDTTEAVLVRVEDADGRVGLGEGCPRDYVTGETLDGALAWLEEQRHQVGVLDDLASLAAFVEAERPELDQHPAAWCALETALLDRMAQRREISLEALLGVAEDRRRFAYTGVVPAGPPRVVGALAARWLALGVSELKVKVGSPGDDDPARLAAVRTAMEAADRPVRLRLDANNAWGRDREAAREALAPLVQGVAAVEEPLAPGRMDDLRHLSETLGVRIVLDESLTRAEQAPALAADPERWIVNLKVSKAGGPLRALALLRATAEADLDVLIGAQVGETSILTRLGLLAARAAGDRLYAMEGAVGTLLLHHEAVSPELRMGPGGLLDLDQAGLGPHGLGLTEGAA